MLSLEIGPFAASISQFRPRGCQRIWNWVLAGWSMLGPWAIGDQPRGSNPKAYLAEKKVYQGKRREGAPRESLVLRLVLRFFRGIDHRIVRS